MGECIRHTWLKSFSVIQPIVFSTNVYIFIDWLLLIHKIDCLCHFHCLYLYLYFSLSLIRNWNTNLVQKYKTFQKNSLLRFDCLSVISNDSCIFFESYKQYIFVQTLYNTSLYKQCSCRSTILQHQSILYKLLSFAFEISAFFIECSQWCFVRKCNQVGLCIYTFWYSIPNLLMTAPDISFRDLLQIYREIFHFVGGFRIRNDIQNFE